LTGSTHEKLPRHGDKPGQRLLLEDSGEPDVVNQGKLGKGKGKGNVSGDEQLQGVLL
jgi:hypothetical protein